MELFTMGNGFYKEEVVDEFSSVIWTERYYGNSEFELVVPATTKMFETLKENKFVGLVGSEEPMIVDTVEVENGKLKVSGSSVLSWMNNRIIRTSSSHDERNWVIEGLTPGAIMMTIIQYMCIDSPYLDGSAPTGIPNPWIYKIPGLVVFGWDNSDPIIPSYSVPFGPVYDAMKEIATTYEIGQKITYAPPGSGHDIMYSNYKGLNRTGSQTANTAVRFSPSMDSLTDIKELHSVKEFKTDVFSFAGQLTALTDGLQPGISSIYTDSAVSGFDRRQRLLFVDDISSESIEGDPLNLLIVLESRAKDDLSDHKIVKVVDGQMVPTAQYTYGTDYNLGDIVELEGYSGITQEARITEYIRTQDTSGEKAFPTVAIITD